jgi:hypothetical protein
MKKLQTIILALSAIIAIVTIIDFSFTGQTITETALSSKAKFERYYNAGGNSHTSHSIHTKSYDFYATEDFQYEVKDHDTLQLKTSLLFNEINSATHLKSNTTETYSLRLYSGLIIPLLFLIAIGVYYKFPYKIAIVTFVLAVLNIGNLVYLWV